MKYLVKNLILFLLFYIALNFVFFIINPGHTTRYNIGNFEIKEIFKSKNNNYYFSITSDKSKINFQIYHNYSKKDKIITKLIYKNISGYECYLPIFKDNKLYTDVMCLKQNVIYYAHDLNNDLINKHFEKYGYDKAIYKDNSSKVTVSNTQTLYKDNLQINDYIGMENYKGLTLFNSKDASVKIFDNDVYKKDISMFKDKYYIVADYNSEYTFNNFYVVNIINGNIKKIRSYDDISFDSYFMGSVDGEFYIFDKDNKIEYKIDIQNESVDKVGDKNNIKFYDGTWKTINLNEALNSKTFGSGYNTKGYEKTYKKDNYYYYYKKIGDKYSVYRSDNQNRKIKTFLFEASDINIIYLKTRIYFRNGNDFCYYGDNGVRKVITNTELEFNDDISLGAYEK